MMIKNKFIDQVNQDLKNLNFIDNKINHKSLNELGFFVLKKAFNKKTIENYRLKFLNSQKKQIVKHLVRHDQYDIFYRLV